MNTGLQQSSSTPYGAWTTTTPGPEWKKMRKNNIVEALVAHRIPYVAIANIAFPKDLVHKVQIAEGLKGSRFIHIYASCPTGWHIPSEMSVKSAHMAVQINIFPLCTCLPFLQALPFLLLLPSLRDGVIRGVAITRFH